MPNDRLLQAALLDIPLEIFRDEPAGLDQRIGRDPDAGLLHRIGLEDGHAADVATGVILEWTGLQELSFVGQAIDVGEVLFLQTIEIGFRDLARLALAIGEMRQRDRHRSGA